MADSSTLLGLKRSAKPQAPVSGQLQISIARIAESDCPVLIAGEHGVGKRSIARHIHALSHRSRAAYTEVQSAEVKEDTLKSALATKGTLYLAEIADLTLDLQELLIHAYQDADWSQNCRLICGASHELMDDVRSWRVREDFYYLFSSVTLRIAPLRYRKADILALADDLLTQYSRQFDRPKPVLCEEMVDFLIEHTWPENLAELHTAIKTVAAIDDPAISLAALKAAAAATRLHTNRRTQPLKQATRVASTQLERRLISEVLAATGGNRKRAADELGISYKALLYKLKQAGADGPPDFNRTGVTR